MPNSASQTFRVHFDPNDQELVIAGSMRPQSEADLANCARLFDEAVAAVRGTLYVNVKKLVRLNNVAFRALAAILMKACTERPDLRISIVTSSVVGWSTRKFGTLREIAPNIAVEEYDSEFYPGQSFVENSDFIHVLRTQTKLTWRHEKHILPRHGMREGLRVADICCGIGDFAALVHRQFKPARLVALDHSRSSLAYARGVAAEFDLHGIEYIYGDAAEMLIENDQFDFVICRHSLQVFDKPERILQELFRICKPGGRVYVTNEKNSHCLGEPRGESIQWTYNEVARLWHHFNMDIEIGPKSRRLLMDTGLEDVKTESFMVTNTDGDPQDFADVIESWKNLFAGDMARQRGDDAAFIEKFRRGFDDHIFAALHPKGYAGWPIWVASGRKPPMTAITDSTGLQEKVGMFSRRSFRTKFILVVGAAVLFDLLLSGGIAIWNVQRLSRDATNQVGGGLRDATQEYLRTYIDSTAIRADLLIERVHSEVTTLADSMQDLIDHPEVQAKVGDALESSPGFDTPLVYNEKTNWSQNAEGAPSAVSVWGYLLGPDHKPVAQAQKEVRDSAILGLVGSALMKTGAPKLQMYYVGPKSASIMRATPYSNQAATFDKLYPGHNTASNFWEFFFPGVYEGWQSWIRNPASRPVDSDIVTTAPYVDAITGKLIVSFFHPLWTADRHDVAGMAAADVTLDQLANLVESVTIAKTGFGFLAMSDGNIIVTNGTGMKALGLKSSDVSGQGVTGVSRTLKESSQAAIRSLQLPHDGSITIEQIHLDQDGEDVPYLVALRRLKPANLWDGKGIVSETMSLGFMVPEREIYASLIAAQGNISAATSRIIDYQLLTVLASLIVVFGAVYTISGRITGGLSMLAEAARRLQNKDYSVRVNLPSHDEVGAVGVAFNRMAEEISFHTENLERLVEERTGALAKANEEITELNTRLKSENLRLGTELDIARQIQMMVLPKPSELGGIPALEVAGYMEPADEVGGDYFDVLQDHGGIKVGIGDVTGHGLESGVLMLMVQSVARALQEKGGGDAKEFLEVLNRAIYKNIERTRTDKHLSLAFLDYADDRVTLSGQHEEVLVMRGDGPVERIDTVDLGFPIGLESDIGPFLGTRDIPFATGDVIILHTDGVTEAESPSGDLFGIERLCESALKHRGGTATEIKDGIVADLMAHIDTQKIHDDITVVIMRHR